MSRHWLKKYLQDKRVQGFYQKFSEKDIDTGIDFTPLNPKLQCIDSSRKMYWYCSAAPVILFSPKTALSLKRPNVLWQLWLTGLRD